MREKGVRFGKAGHLAATLTLPEGECSIGLLLPSAGLLHRIGPHRMNVRLSRQAAATGCAAIRFDLAGIGDSLHSPGRSSYAAQEVQAARDAMDLLEQESGARQFVAAGLCSGADTACLVAGGDPRVVGLFLLEPHFYPGLFSPMLRLLRRLREYGPAFAAARLLQILREEKMRRMHYAVDQDRLRPAAGEYSALLQRLLERDVHLHLVYAGSTMGGLDLRRHRRTVYADLLESPRFRIDLLPGSDHLFTPVPEMRKLEQLFLALLDRVRLPAATAVRVAANAAPAAPAAPAVPLAGGHRRSQSGGGGVTT